MYRKERVVVDWAVVLCVYCLILLIIPISDKLLAYLNQDIVNTILNLAVNILIGLVYLCLLVYLVKRKRKSGALSYALLTVFFIISEYFLMQVKVSTDKLHFLGYGILSIFLYRALRHITGTNFLYVWSALYIMLLAILDEVLQIFGLGGRFFEFKDIGIDWLSGLIGQALIAGVLRPKLETADINIHRYIKGLERIEDFVTAHILRLERFNLDIFAKQICSAFRIKTGHSCGHVHFIYKGKRDHLIMFCAEQRLEKIIAKGGDCRKGEYVTWENSEFSHHPPQQAFLEMLPQIQRIIIDHPYMRKSWSSFAKFQSWLNRAT